MMNFGLYKRGCRVELIDMKSGEVLARTESGVKIWLEAFPYHKLEIFE